jgi:prophage regulatory protein
MPSKPLLRAATRSLASRPSATESKAVSRKITSEDGARITELIQKHSPSGQLHGDQIIRIEQLREIFPFSRPSIYRLIRAGVFPAPISLGGGRAVGWVRSEVEAFIQERKSQRKARPEQVEVAS